MQPYMAHQQVKALAGTTQVIVSETGWPTGGNQIGDAVASPENAATYFLNFVSWARANNVPYYSRRRMRAGRRPTKGLREPIGVYGVMTPGMADIFASKMVADNWSGSSIPGDPGTATLQFIQVPAIGSSDNLKGQVWHLKPAHYKVAVYKEAPISTYDHGGGCEYGRSNQQWT